jgi:hypothetical protein
MGLSAASGQMPTSTFLPLSSKYHQRGYIQISQLERLQNSDFLVVNVTSNSLLIQTNYTDLQKLS